MKIFLLVVSFLWSQNQNFQHYSVESGLAHNTVTKIFQDSKDFIWVGTYAGLNRFDAYKFITFETRVDDSLSLSSARINDIAESSDGRLWFASSYGLNELRKDGRSFNRYIVKKDQKDSLWYDNYFTKLIAADSVLYVATSLGFHIFNLENNQVKKFRLLEANSNNYVLSMHLMTKKYVLIGYRRGLSLFNLETHTNHWLNDPSISTMIVNDINVIEKRIYLSTNMGLMRAMFDLTSKKISSIEHLVKNSTVITANGNHNKLYYAAERTGTFYTTDNFETVHELKPNNFFTNEGINFKDVLSIFTDRQNNLWLGSYDNGLIKINESINKFSALLNDKIEPNLRTTVVWAIEEDKNNHLYFATLGKGVLIYNLLSSERRIINSKTKPLALSDDNVFCVVYSDDDKLWIGTENNGVDIIDFQKNTLINLKNNPKDTNGISGDVIIAMKKAPNGDIWIATFNGGINIYSHQSQKFSHLKKSKNGLYSSQVADFVFMRDTVIIAYQTEGFDIYNSKTHVFSHFENNDKDPNSLSDNSVLSLMIDSKNDLWIGTSAGLNRYHFNQSKFHRFTKSDGFDNDYIYSMVEDSLRNIWIGTNLGVIKLNLINKSIVNFRKEDGLTNNELNQNAVYFDKKNYIYFGTLNGVSYINPYNYNLNTREPLVYITSVKVYNDERFFDGNTIDLKSFTFGHQDDVISFEFSSLDFINPQKNEFAYYMEEFDQKWNFIENRRIATYTNLNPGTYTFKIKATNSDKIWSSEKVYTLIIESPFWATWEFRIIVILFILISIYFLDRLRLKKIESRKLELEKIVHDRTIELMHQNMQLEKLSGFVNLINQETSYNDLLQSIINLSEFIDNIEGASAIILNKNTNLYEFAATYNWDFEVFKEIKITFNDHYERSLKDANKITEGVYINNKLGDARNPQFMENIPIPKSILVFEIILENQPVAFFHFDNLHLKTAFDHLNIPILDNIKQHITTAIIKGKILEQLKELNNSKNEFIGIVAHDLRSPLSQIMGYSDLMVYNLENEDSYPDKNDFITQMKRIYSSAEHMNNIINTLLDISAIESGKINLVRSIVNLNELISESIELNLHMAKRKNISIIFNSEDELINIYIDRNRVMEVLDNLINNAIKYSYFDTEVSIQSKKEEDKVIVSIQDQGQGMTDSDLKNVFYSFKPLSAKPTGGEKTTGFGLVIVKKIVEIHSGEIWVKSRKGQGACFSFSLPLIHEKVKIS